MFILIFLFVLDLTQKSSLHFIPCYRSTKEPRDSSKTETLSQTAVQTNKCHGRERRKKARKEGRKKGRLKGRKEEKEG